jgi:hypothetical protein
VTGTVSATGLLDLPTLVTDTKVAFVNVSTPGIIAHVTVWNKYSMPIFDFNVPMTGKDVATFNVGAILNGRLDVNPTTQVYTPEWSPVTPPLNGDHTPVRDVCGVTASSTPGIPSTMNATPFVGWGQTQYLRFAHPESVAPSVYDDWPFSVSRYGSGDALSGFRLQVMTSLDESGDISEFQSSAGSYILDVDNPDCGKGTVPGVYPAGLADFSGYITIDVVNYCTNFFPDQADFYNKDAIATAGWSQAAYPDFPCVTPCAVTYTPNVLIGDVFYVDSATQGGNVSGDPAVAIEFDSRLGYTFSGAVGTEATTPTTKTFFGKFVSQAAVPACVGESGVGCANPGVPVAFRFPGDGREPLGDHYGFRYLADQANGLQSWAIVWRSDYYQGTAVNLCAWANPGSTANKGAAGSGLYDVAHQVQVLTYDNDENLFGGVGVPPGPSGQLPGTQSPNYIFLESQRINLLTAADWNPAQFKGGWVDVTLAGPGLTGATRATGFFNMGWVGVQHTAPGAFISVGHAASNLNNQFLCSPNRLNGTVVNFQTQATPFP